MLELFKVIIENDDNWTFLNWLYDIINEETDYQAHALSYLNVGESQINKLEVYYFQSEKSAIGFLRMLCAYHGKDGALEKSRITITRN